MSMKPKTLDLQYLMLSYPRSGCHMLQSALSQHPQLVVEEEAYSAANYPVNFFDFTLQLFARANGAILHVPDVTFTATNYDFQTLEQLDAETAVRWLHVWREDWLAMFVSYKQAFLTGAWGLIQQEKQELYPSFIQRISPDAYEPVPFTVYVNEMVSFHRLVTRWQAETQNFLRQKNHLHVRYEQLRDDWDKELTRVQEFLGLDVVPLKPLVQQQIQQPHTDLILNWEELEPTYKTILQNLSVN